MSVSNNSLKAKFDKWKKDNDQYGKQAFPRYMMLTFLSGLDSTSDEFIFKGGNLLWHYIKTPRATVDLDLSTVTLASHKAVQNCFEKSFAIHEGIIFSIKKYASTDSEKEVGAKVVIGYETETGQKNSFSVDVVYSLPTDVAIVKSTIGKGSHLSASIENIIADKMHASYKYRGGNTRMKDFDDLWRISKSDKKIRKSKIKKLFKEKEVDFYLDENWAEFMDIAWRKHSKVYSDLPNDIKTVFLDINDWLTRLK